MFHLDRIQQRLFIAMAVVIVILAGILLYNAYFGEEDNAIILKPSESPGITGEPEDENDAADSAKIKVYITGSVQRPGIVELVLGDRLADAVELAGGALPDADLERVNMALKVVDEGMYHIPEIGEEYTAPATEAPSDNNNTGKGEGRININTAGQSQLETLPGIGPVKAQNIIKYREDNGGFKKIEDILNVSGIGEKTFEGMKDFISVN